MWRQLPSALWLLLMILSGSWAGVASFLLVCRSKERARRLSYIKSVLDPLGLSASTSHNSLALGGVSLLLSSSRTVAGKYPSALQIAWGAKNQNIQLLWLISHVSVWLVVDLVLDYLHTKLYFYHEPLCSGLAFNSRSLVAALARVNLRVSDDEQATCC